MPNFDEDATSIIISKSSSGLSKNITSLEVGKKYSIIVANYIVKPFDGFTLHDNWNKGIIPTDTHMIVRVLQIIGKMICIDSIGVTDNKRWVGWVPLKSILSFEEID